MAWDNYNMSPDTRPGKKPEPELVEVPEFQVIQPTIVARIKRKMRKVVPKGNKDELVDDALVVSTPRGTKVVNILPNEVMEESEAKRIMPEGVTVDMNNADQRLATRRRKKRKGIESTIKRGS